ncbi:tipN [Brevundimonas sp.]|uniref:tipN n=1 Tax=Brevundimonas sp. TaxID=1871086 RepID=UPI0025FCBE1D|nr:tipN [Brevundimonas sp.]
MKTRTRPPLDLKEDGDVITPDLQTADTATLPDTVTETAPATAPEPQESLPAPAARPRSDNSAKAAYPLAVVAALLWIGGVASYAAYEVGGGRLDLEPVNIALLALIAAAPAGLVLVVAHLARQAAALAAEARRARDMVDALVLPTSVAARESGQVLIGLRSDIDESASAAERARNEIIALRAAMDEETRRLNEAADLAQRTARRLADQLSKERVEMTDLGKRLEGQTQDVVDTIERQARMVADASDLAQTQLREAEAALAARAADLATAAGEAQDAARAASDDLARQTMRLETAGSGVADQIRSVEEGLSEQRAALVQAAFGLRRDQEDFSAQVETQRAQLAEALAHTRVAGGELGESAAQSAKALQDLAEAAADQVKALGELAENEAKTFDARTREALDRFEDLAAQARQDAAQQTEQSLASLNESLAQTRAAADAAVVEARERIERLSEAVFAAGQAADSTAEQRLAATNRIIEETAGMGEAAGRRIADRLEASITDARAALADIEGALDDIDSRVARLPEQAKARIDEIRETVEASLQAVGEATRRAAEETQAVDAAFQDRVRKNYDMLSEAVRLMGVVSGEGLSQASRREPAPAPADPAPQEGFGLRGRLKLAPTGKDEEVRRVFEPAAAQPEAPTEKLSWKDLLAGAAEPSETGADEGPPAAEDKDLTQRLTASILDLGVDPGALLPRARVEEAAEALGSGSPDRARQIVRRVAPAAVRRISRRVLTDRELRAEAERFVRHYDRSIAQAVRAGDSQAVGHLLVSEPGRTYLLLEAAVGDLA